MPRRNRRSNNRRRNRRRGPRTVGYAAPIMRTMNNPTDMTVTLHANMLMSSGVTATNGGYRLVDWIFFNDAATLAPLYKYFEVVSCRIRPSLATTAEVVDSFLGGAVAYVPINYWVEGQPAFAPTQLNQVNELPGSVYLQPGANNFGRWFNPRIKQQFSTVDAFLGATQRPAGTLVWYLSDAGVSEEFGECDIEVNVRFYQREYSSVTSLLEVRDLLAAKRTYTNCPRPEPEHDITVISEAPKSVKTRLQK